MKMKKKLLLIAGLCVVVILLSLSGFVGCDSSGESTPHDTSTQQDKSTTAEFEFPNEDLLGYPLYKENVDRSSVKGNKEESDGELQEVTLDYETSDPYDAVLAFYEGEVGVPTQTDELPGGYSRAMYDMDEGGFHTVIVITQIKDATAVSVMREKLP